MTRVHADSERTRTRHQSKQSERPQTARIRREDGRNAAPARALARLNRTHGNQAVQRFVATRNRFGTRGPSDEGSAALKSRGSDSTAEQSTAERSEERSETGQSETERSEENEEDEDEGAIEFFEFDEPIPLSMLDWIHSHPHHIGSNDPLWDWLESGREAELGSETDQERSTATSFEELPPPSAVAPTLDLGLSRETEHAESTAFDVPDLDPGWITYVEMWNDGGMGIGGGTDHDRTAGVIIGRRRTLEEAGLLEWSVNLTLITPPGYLEEGVPREYPEEYSSPEGPWLALFYYGRTEKLNNSSSFDVTWTTHLGFNSPITGKFIQDTVHWIPLVNSPVFADWDRTIFEHYIGMGPGIEGRFERDIGPGTVSGSAGAEALLSTHRSYATITGELEYRWPEFSLGSGSASLFQSIFGSGTGFLRYNDGRDPLAGIEGELGMEFGLVVERDSSIVGVSVYSSARMSTDPNVAAHADAASSQDPGPPLTLLDAPDDAHTQGGITVWWRF